MLQYEEYAKNEQERQCPDRRRDQGIMALTRNPLDEGVAMRRELGEPQARVDYNYDYPIPIV